MKMRISSPHLRIGRALLLAAVGCVACASSASAFEPITTCTTPDMVHYETSVHCDPGEEPLVVGWPTPCVTYMLNERGSKDVDRIEFLKSTIKSSFIVWNQPSCGNIQFRFGGISCAELTGAPVAPKGQFVPPPENDENLIIWREESWDKASAIVAHTALTYDPSDGVIYNADIEFNAVDHTFELLTPEMVANPKSDWLADGSMSGPYDVQNILTHEIGHFLGLHHEETIVEATMFPTGEALELLKRDLHPDDVNGLCYLYSTGYRDAMCVNVAPEDENQCLGRVQLDGKIGCSTADPALPAQGPGALLWLVGLLGVLGLGLIPGASRLPLS